MTLEDFDFNFNQATCSILYNYRPLLTMEDCWVCEVVYFNVYDEYKSVIFNDFDDSDWFGAENLKKAINAVKKSWRKVE